MIRAIVSHKGRKRYGKGFSLNELRMVGLDIKKAREIGIPFDKRRKSTIIENVNMLKNFLKSKNTFS
jgi:large subunit ribosomal protein L13e